MSDLLKEFLVAWLEWAERGAPEDDCEPFARYKGLCISFEDWMELRDVDHGSAYCESDQLKSLFIADGLAGDYPFGECAYIWAMNHDQQHLDVNRLSWVRSKVAQHEAA
jgi:hypothetical protein